MEYSLILPLFSMVVIGGMGTYQGGLGGLYGTIAAVLSTIFP